MILNFIPKNGDMFVDLNQPYENIKFVKAELEKGNESELVGISVAGKPMNFERKKLAEFVGPFFPLFSSIWKPRAELSEFYSLYRRIMKLVDNFLAKQDGFCAKTSDLESEIVKNGYTLSETQAVLKSLLTSPMDYLFAGKNSEGKIYFGKDKARFLNWSSYYRSIAEELRIKSKQIGLLVSHGPTVGNFREILLRDLIRKFLPEKFRIATGFIQGFSNQIDILIFDAHNYGPLFQEGDLVVVRQEAVRAVIEVKTTLTTRTLTESLELLHKISLPGYRTTKLPIFKAVYSFGSNIKHTSSVAKRMSEFYNKPYFDSQLKTEFVRGISYLFHQVSCVATLNQHCVFSKYQSANSDGTGNMVPHLYSIEDENGLDIQTAMFMSLLFEYLDVETYAKKSSTWNVIERLNNSGKLRTQTKLTSDDWAPSFASEEEHTQEQHSIRHRISTFEKWFNGQLSTEALIKDQTKSRTSLI
jgi:hypothetical protein